MTPKVWGIKRDSSAAILGAIAVLTAIASGGCAKKNTELAEDKTRKGLQTYPKTLEEVPPEYREMARQMMESSRRQGGPPPPPKAPPATSPSKAAK